MRREIDPKSRKEVLYRHHLARDYLESADLLRRNAKFRDAAPLFGKAVREELRALAALVESDQEPVPSLLGKHPELAHLGAPVDLERALEVLEEVEAQGSRDPAVQYPSSREVFRRLYHEVSVFLNLSDRFIRDTLRSEKERRWRRRLARAAGIGCLLLAVVLAVVAGLRWWRTTSAGLRGEYFRGRDLQESVHRQVDGPIDLQWSTEDPPSGLGAFDFSVRWTGSVEVASEGRHRFIVRSDDGARLWVDDQIVVDAWLPQAATDRAGTIILEPGWHGIRLEYFQGVGGAQCQLRWQPPGGRDEVIPIEVLRPD